MGVEIVAESQVVQIVHGEPCEVFTRDGKVFAQEVVVATNDPISHPGFMHTKIASYRSYAVALQVSEPHLPKGLFWDLDEPYHYLRRCHSADGNVLIVGGEDHKTGIEEKTSDRFANLESYCISRLQVERVITRWSGQIIETVDGLPYIGSDRAHPHLYLATGFSGNGMTWGAFSASLIADQILEKPTEWADLFSPNRLNPKASFEKYLLENKDFPLCYVGDRVKQVGALEDLHLREGAVVEVSGQRVAAYRDEQGHIQAFSPYCPHMGCYVRWNNAEATWDCPCHGSRFDTAGKVLNGPSTENLKPVFVEEQLKKLAVSLNSSN
jgi:nitrite reductase/ring-hydroxylating ferredoxin subunit